MPYGVVMRWDRLFADLEGSAFDEHADERDALAEDLSDEQWAVLSWTEVLGDPDVRLRVVGVGEVAGPVTAAGELLLIGREGRRLAVLPDAVTAVSGCDGRAAAVPRLSRTRRQFARALRDEGSEVRIAQRDGSVLEGRVVAVGADFVQLSVGARRVTVPWTWIAAVSQT